MPDDYRDFGPYRETKNKEGHFPKHGETLSERLMFGLRNEIDKNTKILWRAGKMNNRSNSEKGTKLIEQHLFESNEIDRLSETGGEITCTSNKRKRTRKITQPNLKARTVQYETSIISTVANDLEGYSVFRQVYTGAYGTGVKTRFPSTKNVNNCEMNPTNLTKASIVNCVDVEYTPGEMTLDGAVNADLFGKGRNINSIQIDFDPIDRTAYTRIRATPMAITTASEPINNFLTSYGTRHAELREEDDNGPNAVNVGVDVGTMIWGLTRVE